MGASHHYLDLLDSTGNPVKGEAVKTGFVDQIEITGWSWSIADKKVEQKAKLPGAPDSGSRVEPSIFGVSKEPDLSSIRMLSAMHTGEVFEKASFTLFEELQGTGSAASGGFHLVVVLTKVVFTKLALSANASDKETTMSEEWDLNYHSIDFKYKKGAMQVQMIRPADASDESNKKPVDEALDKYGSLDEKERAQFKGKFGDIPLPGKKSDKEPGK